MATLYLRYLLMRCLLAVLTGRNARWLARARATRR